MECYRCGTLLFEGRDMISIYRLRRRTDGKCPGCGRKLAVRPLRIHFQNIEFTNLQYPKP